MTLNLLQELTKLILNSEVYNSPDGILKNKLIEDGFKNDPTLIKLLLTNPSLKIHFFTELDDGILVFNSLKFQQFLTLKDFLPDSYTSFKNKIGLTGDGGYITQNKNVVLDFPFKDCMLEGGQSKDDVKRKEIFWNETLAPDEIDVLLEPKILTNAKKYTAKGIEEITEFNRNSEGVITDNLIIKGNNLIALHSLKKEFKGKVKLIYIDPPYNTGSDSFGYNDKFNHSTWLVFMKNRLEVARELLRDDGVIFVQCDDNEQAYLKVLMDEIFGVAKSGKSNFIQMVDIKANVGAANEFQNPFMPKNCEYGLFYAKNYDKRTYKQLWMSRNYDEAYSKIILNPQEVDYQKWEIGTVKVEIEKEYSSKYKDLSQTKINDFVIKNANIIFQGIGVKGAGKGLQEAMKLSEIDTWATYTREIKDNIICYQGRMVRFYSKNIIEVDKKPTISKELGSLWDDILWNGISGEGGVTLKSGKKPEKLLQRIIEMSSSPNDIVLDYHLGSGTTAAVAQKMGRQYIGVEQMNYIETISVERMKKVIGQEITTTSPLGMKETKIENFDNGGISKAINWQGGGEFVYCELKQYNQDFVESIQGAIDIKELSKIWQDIQVTGFISYKVDPKTINTNITEFESLSLEDGQRFLMEVLDKNMLYVNYSDIDNDDYSVSEEEKLINKSFYKGKK